MTKTEIGQLILFIVIELVGLIPVGIRFLIKRSDEDHDGSTKFADHYMYRALIIDIVCIPLYILLPDKRTYVVLLLGLGQILNSMLFRKRH